MYKCQVTLERQAGNALRFCQGILFETSKLGQEKMLCFLHPIQAVQVFLCHFVRDVVFIFCLYQLLFLSRKCYKGYKQTIKLEPFLSLPFA